MSSASDPAFGLIASQLLGVAPKDGPAKAPAPDAPARGCAESAETRSAAPQIMQTATSMVSAPVSGLQNKGTAEQNSVAAEQPGSQPEDGKDAKASADAPAETPMLSSGVEEPEQTKPFEQKVLHLQADTKEKETGIPALAHDDGDNAHIDPEARLASQEKTDFIQAARYDSPAAQPQAAHASSIMSAGHAEGHPRAVRPAADPAELFENTVSIIRDGNRLAVKLEPDGLGKLDINLNLKNGVIHAQINVQDNAAKALIENNMQQILDGLLKEGLSVGGFSVSLQKGDVRQQASENYGYAGAAEVAPDFSPGAGGRPLIGLVNLFV